MSHQEQRERMHERRISTQDGSVVVGSQGHMVRWTILEEKLMKQEKHWWKSPSLFPFLPPSSLPSPPPHYVCAWVYMCVGAGVCIPALTCHV